MFGAGRRHYIQATFVLSRCYQINVNFRFVSFDFSKRYFCAKTRIQCHNTSTDRSTYSLYACSKFHYVDL